MAKEVFQGKFGIKEGNFVIEKPIPYSRYVEQNPQVEDYVGDWSMDGEGFDRNTHDMVQLRLRLKGEGKL